MRTLLIIIAFSISFSNCHSQVKLKYYGVDGIRPSEYPFLRDSLGGNYALIELNSDTVSLKNTLAAAENSNLNLIIWPVGGGHQWTPWAWDGSSWDISEGLEFIKYAEKYVTSGGQALLAVLMSHEPFYNGGDPFTATEMKMLYAKLKSAAPHVKLFVYMNDMSYYDNRTDTPITDSLMDIAGTYLHTFGGAEGTLQGTLNSIDNDYALIQSKGLNMELFFSIQAFGIAGTKYKMPSADAMLDLATKILDKNKLDGFSWYSWNRVASSYTSYLSKDRYDDVGADRWKVVTQLSSYLYGVNIETDKIISDQTKLAQNYPNPFGTSTTISFKLVDSGLYSLRVFNVFGQLVAEIFRQEKAPGDYTINFEAGDLPQGPYFYSLEHNKKVITKKMMIQ